MLAISHGCAGLGVDNVSAMATKKTPAQDVGKGELGHFLGPWMAETDTKNNKLAKHLNVDPSTITKWVKGEREPTIANLREAAAFMDIDLTALFFHPTDNGVRATAAKMDDDVLGVVLKKRLGK